jgi:hypothetical protein
MFEIILCDAYIYLETKNIFTITKMLFENVFDLHFQNRWICNWIGWRLHCPMAVGQRPKWLVYIQLIVKGDNSGKLSGNPSLTIEDISTNIKVRNSWFLYISLCWTNPHLTEP